MEGDSTAASEVMETSDEEFDFDDPPPEFFELFDKLVDSMKNVQLALRDRVRHEFEIRGLPNPLD